MHRIAIASILTLGLAACATAETPPPAAVSAQPAVVAAPSRCVPHPEVLASALAGQFGEHIGAYGIDASGGLVQVYSNTESGTWTIAVTRPDGVTRIVSAGEAWTTTATPKAGV